MKYEEIYTERYFSGKDSFFYKATGGYRDVKRYFDRLKGWFSPYVQGPRILDIGCAYGFMLKRFQERGELYGVDVSAYALKKAQENLPEGKFFQVTVGVDPLPFPPDHFQTIFMNDVLEHLTYPHQEEALKEVFRVLTPGGFFLVTTPNGEWIRKTFYFLPDRLEHHIGLRGKEEWKRLFEKEGFSIVTYWTYLHGLFPFRITGKGSLPEVAFVLTKPS